MCDHFTVVADLSLDSLADVFAQSRSSAPATSHVSSFLSDDLLGLVGDAQKPPLFAVEVCLFSSLIHCECTHLVSP